MAVTSAGVNTKRRSEDGEHENHTDCFVGFGDVSAIGGGVKIMMTAKEGADRVAARRKAAGPNQENDHGDQPMYCCENCSHEQFSVICKHTQLSDEIRTLKCECERSEDHAVRQVTIITELGERSGELDDTHHFQLSPSELEVEDRQVGEDEVGCRECLDKSGGNEDAWEVERTDPRIENEYIEVRCDGCGHEIEFGWSHEDRGGRIWPVESADHNPWLSWPEPRFIDNWKERGWLRSK